MTFVCVRCNVAKHDYEEQKQLSSSSSSVEKICLGCFFKPPMTYTAPKFGYELDTTLVGFTKSTKHMKPVAPRCRMGHLMTDYKDSFPSDYQPNTLISCDACQRKNVPLHQHYFHCDTCTDFDFCADCATTLTSS